MAELLFGYQCALAGCFIGILACALIMPGNPWDKPENEEGYDEDGS